MPLSWDNKTTPISSLPISPGAALYCFHITYFNRQETNQNPIKHHRASCLESDYAPCLAERSNPIRSDEGWSENVLLCGRYVRIRSDEGKVPASLFKGTRLFVTAVKCQEFRIVRHPRLWDGNFKRFFWFQQPKSYLSKLQCDIDYFFIVYHQFSNEE